MALTADQITAQNFKDFYGEIRPYLSGQVPTFANAFNRSDLYSTDEKIIGCWTDGKPVYQRTLTGLSVSVTSGTWNAITSDLSNVHNFIGCECYYGADGDRSALGLRGAQIINGTTFRIDPIEARTITVATIQYTKTTDQAIKVGTGNDYSTDEQIIGTWIDGKPLYQKVFVFQNEITVTTSWTNLGIAIENLDKIIYCAGNRGGTSYASYPLNADYESAIPTLQAMACRASGEDLIKQLILQYTKTTD